MTDTEQRIRDPVAHIQAIAAREIAKSAERRAREAEAAARALRDKTKRAYRRGLRSVQRPAPQERADPAYWAEIDPPF